MRRGAARRVAELALPRSRSAAAAASAAGHLPQPAVGAMVVGKVGAGVTPEQGAEAAKFVALNILATLKVRCAARAARKEEREARLGLLLPLPIVVLSHF